MFKKLQGELQSDKKITKREREKSENYNTGHERDR